MPIKSALSRFAKFLLPPALYARVRALYSQIAHQPGTAALPEKSLEAWDVYLQDPRMDSRLRSMLTGFIEKNEATMTSAYWSVLCRKNVAQLLDMKYENFKQTVALNYFTWLVGEEDPQAVFLFRNLPDEVIDTAKRYVDELPSHNFMTKEQSAFFNMMTYLLWDYTERTVGTDLLRQLEEPLEGNPPSFQLSGKTISQDLANSVLEYHSVRRGLPNIDNVKTIMELGGGYGRTAYVFVRMMPQVRYVMVDIPPALYIAERYLTGQLPDRRAFRYRSFGKFAEIEEEFRQSNLAFLMPDQLELLPENITDLFIAIDCLHEMRPEQIKRYFMTIDRLSSLSVSEMLENDYDTL